MNPKTRMRRLEQMAVAPVRTNGQDYIGPFRGSYAFLSNFYPQQVNYRGRLYQTSEHAYQCAKLVRTQDRDIVAQAQTPGEAKRLARKFPHHLDFNKEKLDVMRGILDVKFKPGTAMADKLCATGSIMLYEVNWWNDLYWGVNYQLVGHNYLGQILMTIREQLRRKTK